jgi:alpha-glucosidase
MFDVVRYWLDMGVVGFRLDAIGTVYEDEHMPDYPQLVDLDDLYRYERNAKASEELVVLNRRRETVFHYQHDQPEVHPLMRELRAVVDEYQDRVLVGETDDLSFYGNGRDELHLVFNFPLMRTDRLTVAWVRANQESRLEGLPAEAWPCNTLGNHDSPRMFSSFAGDGNPADTARVNLAMLLTLWGTPFLYNGEEIGMSDYLFTDLARFRDPLALYAYHMEKRVMQASESEALQHAARRGRDKCRTPLQWSNTPNGGFCPQDIESWLPVNPDFASGVNFADQQQDQLSLWSYYRSLLQLRKQTPALQVGSYEPVHETSTSYLAFLRRSAEQTCMVVLNFSGQEQAVSFGSQHWKTLFSSHPQEGIVQSKDLRLQPFEVWIGEQAES